MHSKTLCLVGMVVMIGCGNYSNEDIDFQLALPEQSEIEAKFPQALSNADSAEYYQKTRDAVLQFNGTLSSSIDLIEKVRGYTPTTRQGTRRIWGPFPSETHPTWLVRVVMEKSEIPDSPNLLGMNYAVQLSRVGVGTWSDFLTGSYVSTGSAREGRGEIHWWVGRGRNIAYPVDADGFAGLDEIHIQYDTQTDPISVRLQIINVLGQSTRGVSYNYWEYKDGSGKMIFDLYLTALPNLTAQIVSRWQSTGAGRADLAVTIAGITGINETDCWGMDSLPTYVYRRQNTPEVIVGGVNLCVFDEPLMQ